jgi:hypothetical protein
VGLVLHRERVNLNVETAGQEKGCADSIDEGVPPQQQHVPVEVVVFMSGLSDVSSCRFTVCRGGRGERAAR